MGLNWHPANKASYWVWMVCGYWLADKMLIPWLFAYTPTLAMIAFGALFYLLYMKVFPDAS